MTSYTVQGHPLNVYQIADAQDAENIHVALINNGIGQTVTLTLTAGNDTKIKNHGALK